MIAAQLIVGGFSEERIKKAQKLVQPFFSKPVDLNNPPIDLFIIRPDDSIGINQIRALKKFLSRRPYQSVMKVCLILEAEKLTLPAQNSLLKTLEEPPAHSLIILLASQSEGLFPTIISRVKITRLPAKSKIRPSEEETKQLIKTLNRLLAAGVGERLRLSLSLVKNRDQALFLVENLLFLWRQLLLAKIGIKKESFRFPNKANLEEIEKAIKNTEQVRKMLAANVNFHLAIESLFLSYPFFKLESSSKN